MDEKKIGIIKIDCTDEETEGIDVCDQFSVRSFPKVYCLQGSQMWLMGQQERSSKGVINFANNLIDEQLFNENMKDEGSPIPRRLVGLERTMKGITDVS